MQASGKAQEHSGQWMSTLARGTVWTLAGYTVSQSLRFLTNVVLARLLAPEIFGIFTIVNTLRTGAELLSDVGTTQSVIQARDAENPLFYNSAWTIQIIRGALVFLTFISVAYPASRYFEIPNLSEILTVSGFTFLIGGFTSVGPCILQRRMELARLKRFEIVVAVVFTMFQVFIAYIHPTVWALVWGLVFGTAFRAVTSFLLLRLTYRIILVKEYVRRIFEFAKWISLSSVLYFFTMSFDRLYLASVLPLGVLGVYSIARTIGEIVGLFVLSLGNSLVLPYIAANAHRDRAILRREVARVRTWFLLASAIGLSVLIASGDLAVTVLFDARYRSAGWMTSVLLIGSWFSLLCALNETTLLGFGKSVYAATGNGVKFVWLAGALPLGLSRYGIAGAVVAVAAADAFRYVPMLTGQVRERFSFFVEDLGATLLLLLLLGCWVGVRWTF